MKENWKGGSQSNDDGEGEEEHVEPNPIFTVCIDEEEDGDVGGRRPKDAH